MGGPSIHLYTCNLGTNRTTTKDPIFGREVVLFDDPGLTKDEYSRAIELIGQLQHEGPDEEGTYCLALAGESVMLSWDQSADGHCLGCIVEPCGWLTLSVREFLLDLARKGNMCIMSMQDEAIAYAISQSQLEAIRVRFPKAALVASEVELKALLTPHEIPLKAGQRPSLFEKIINLFRSVVQK